MPSSPDPARASYGLETTPNAAPDRSDAPAQDVNPNGVDLARLAGFPSDHRDARIAAIAAANVNGDYGTLDGSNPAVLEDNAGSLDSDALHGAGGEKRKYPY